MMHIYDKDGSKHRTFAEETVRFQVKCFLIGMAVLAAIALSCGGGR